ncbi:MAG: Plug domain-containing protein, partial [Verrucomicrobiota bacterium]
MNLNVFSRSSRLPRWIVCAAFWLIAALASGRAADEGKKTFDVPAGNASETLKRFASQAGREIVFSVDAVGDVKTHAVKGVLTSREALDAMLMETGLVARQDEKTGALAVRRERAEVPRATPEPQATESAAPRQTSTRTVRSTLSDDSVMTLSPFEVTTDRDVGYTASNSLAGGRLNSDLRDTAVAISVFTKDFLDDIGVTSVNEALEYGLNTATEYDATGNSHLGNNFNFRIRGISGAQRSRNLFRTQLNLDSYNTERLDFSRGPNAILFGEGSPAGLINTSTKTAKTTHN